MADLEKIRARLKEQAEQAEKPARERRARGRLGEIIVEAWLREQCGLEVQPLPQDIGTKHLLLPEGGKRPDFAVAFSPDEDVFFVDAKLHVTNNLKQFSLEAKEIEDFRLAMRQLKVDVLLIALVPLERVNHLYLIGLDEIAEENRFGAAGVFELDQAGEQWLIGHITKQDYEAAQERLRKEGVNDDVPHYPDHDER
jgi:hypothetical protein